MRRTLAATLLLASTLATVYPLAANAADSQSACGNAKATFKVLKEKFKQAPIAGGMISKNVILVIFATDDAAKWSAWAVDAEGNACQLSAGIDWSQAAAGQPS